MSGKAEWKEASSLVVWRFSGSGILGQVAGVSGKPDQRGASSLAVWRFSGVFGQVLGGERKMGDLSSLAGIELDIEIAGEDEWKEVSIMIPMVLLFRDSTLMLMWTEGGSPSSAVE